MSSKFLKRIRILSIVVFSIGIVMASLAFSINHKPKPGEVVGYTMTSTQTFIANDDGKPWIQTIKTRYQKSDGTWRLIDKCQDVVDTN